MWKHIFYTGGFILLVIAVIGFLFGLITQPLKTLSREMDLTTMKGDVNLATVKRQDEIGSLQKSFYRMLGKIKEDEEERERTQKKSFSYGKDGSHRKIDGRYGP